MNGSGDAPGRWWLCPNDPPCPHGAILHDVEEYRGDGTDTCCADGCTCRGPRALNREPAAPGRAGLLEQSMARVRAKVGEEPST